MKLKNWFKATGIFFCIALGAIGLALAIDKIGPQGLGMITVICIIGALIYWLKTVFDAQDKQEAEKLLREANRSLNAQRAAVPDMIDQFLNKVNNDSHT